MKGIENSPNLGPKWIRPNFARERGEIERVTREFLNQEPTEENITNLERILESAPVVELSESEWKALENTDSFHNVTVGDIESAASLIEGSNAELDPGNRRDFGDLLAKMQSGSEMEAPAIVRKGNRSHLVSGNTRLMISRVLSYRPKVVMAEVP